MSDAVWRDATLHRLGAMPWPELLALVSGASCAWADLDGFHVEIADRLPATPVGITHLWAWAGTRAWRVRVDGTRALVAAADLAPHAGGSGDAVRVRVRPGQPWGVDDAQVARQSDAAHAMRLELIEMPGPAPATFVRGAEAGS